MLHRLNGALVVLIPKKDGAAAVGDYRPISLVHSFAKLITKILVNCLAPKFQSIVATNQSAFIRGHSIHDNFGLVQHTVKYLHNQKAPRLMIELDITKAFDTVSWGFLLQLLQHLGFRSKWCQLICALLSSSKTRILLNGKPGESIQHRRGLRQGDEPSPLLFILVMDVLTALITRAEARNLLQPLATR